MVAFQTSDCNTHGYYIVKWTGNAYTLQGKYKCHAFIFPLSPNPGYLTWKKPNNHVILSNQEHVSNLQYYWAIINGILPNLI